MMDERELESAAQNKVVRWPMMLSVSPKAEMSGEVKCRMLMELHSDREMKWFTLNIQHRFLR